MGRRGGGRGRGRGGGGGAPAAGEGRGRGPRLDSRLLRQLDGGRTKDDDDDDDDDEEVLAKNFYEYEEGIADEESGKNRRYDDVEHVEYELPSDFEDEEIDEDAALGEEDAGLEETIKSKRRQDDESDLDLNSDEEEDESGEEDDEESDGEGDEEDEESEEEEDEEEDDEKHQQMLEAVTGKPQQLRNGIQLGLLKKTQLILSVLRGAQIDVDNVML